VQAPFSVQLDERFALPFLPVIQVIVDCFLNCVFLFNREILFGCGVCCLLIGIRYITVYPSRRFWLPMAEEEEGVSRKVNVCDYWIYVVHLHLYFSYCFKLYKCEMKKKLWTLQVGDLLDRKSQFNLAL